MVNGAQPSVRVRVCVCVCLSPPSPVCLSLSLPFSLCLPAHASANTPSASALCFVAMNARSMCLASASGCMRRCCTHQLQTRGPDIPWRRARC